MTSNRPNSNKKHKMKIRKTQLILRRRQSIFLKIRNTTCWEMGREFISAALFCLSRAWFCLSIHKLIEQRKVKATRAMKSKSLEKSHFALAHFLIIKTKIHCWRRTSNPHLTQWATSHSQILWKSKFANPSKKRKNWSHKMRVKVKKSTLKGCFPIQYK